MEKSAIERMASVEDSHWWFAGRRKFIATLIKRSNGSARNMHILEAGCGTGGNLKMLAQFGDVSAFEADETALKISAGRGNVLKGRLPDKIPFAPESFDLVAALDVLEHIEDDNAAMEAMQKMLKIGGNIIITVPAYQWLWSIHDVTHHHIRRYSLDEIKAKIRAAGFEIRHATYFNSLLFPLMLMQRQLEKHGIATNADKMPPAWLNFIMKIIFFVESIWAGIATMPIGGSIVLLARNTARSS